MKFHESVMVGDDYLVFDLKGEEEERTRERWVLLDTGFRFLKARTVQDLLMAVYDTLEVHRSQLLLRSVLHRDMSSYNILMYPIWGDADARKVNPNLPPTIQDVLAGSIRPAEQRFPLCLSIDYDNAALLDSDNVSPEDLKHRTGTPMYIARGVSLGAVFTEWSCRSSPPMPELSDEARELYVRAHGEGRYEKYNDVDGTMHGAFPPNPRQQFRPRPAFRHRPEHDVESVYWSMISALLRVHPKNVDREARAELNMIQTWELLLSHEIPDQRSRNHDVREAIVKQTEDAWTLLFLGDMKDVGFLLWDISQHIHPEYALWNVGLQPDHLHEAVQRLILQYLVDHKEPIELDPEYSRPITRSKKPANPATRTSTTTGTGSGAKRATRASARSSKTRVDAEPATGSASKRKSMDVDIAQSTSSGTRVSDISGAVVVEPKRKGSSRAGRSSKRMRDNTGRPQSIEEHSEDEA
uniref:Probable 3-oxoacyl-[acyl-carrier-protein] reductase oxidoreductase (EC) n=1 Tax=Ganoderma boninense TaxID=34458 RepID=A0A5K1K754_9APHY|nr:Probable 3-oxoacyl-[acyl-carrier-protein] reductase oxidoreductase (EC [Ganoderma boninense]